MNNKITGSILICAGITILSIIIMILYHLNNLAIWIAEFLGTSPEASVGIQILIALIGAILLFSVMMASIMSIIFGVGYFRNTTPFNIMEKIQRKLFKKFFNDFDNFF